MSRLITFYDKKDNLNGEVIFHDFRENFFESAFGTMSLVILILVFKLGSPIEPGNLVF